MPTPVKSLQSVLQSPSSSFVSSVFYPSIAILVPLPGQPKNSRNMESVQENPASPKTNSKEQSAMLPPPTPASSAPRAPSPEEANVEVQVKASQPSREATPPTSDDSTPPKAQVVDAAEDDETDQDPNQEVDDDETVHDLQVYDWSKLEEEYEAAMMQCDEKEGETTEEFKRLANYFSQWSSVSQVEDRERSAKRYKTREAHIMHSEFEYQKKKEHFDKVVDAFKSAMELLKYT